MEREYSDLVVEGVSHYLLRQERMEHPAGRFDKGGRFWLREACGKDCLIRTPSRTWPYSQLVHGRTLEHCVRALGGTRVEVSAARSLLAHVRRGVGQL